MPVEYSIFGPVNAYGQITSSSNLMKVESVYGNESPIKQMRREEAEALAAQAAEALAKITEREMKFGIDDVPNGTIIYADIKWLKREKCGDDRQFKNQKIYNYAFIKAGGLWYSSGPRAFSIAFTWDSLVDWLSERYIVKMGYVQNGIPIIRKDKAV